VAKAKETRMFVEKIITRAKNSVAAETGKEQKDVSARRLVFSALRNRGAVTALFNEIAPKVSSRPGGYTRVIKLGRRLGDNAELAVLGLVDFNVGQDKSAAKTEKKSVEKKKNVLRSKKAKPAQKTSESAELKAEKEDIPAPKSKESKTEKG
jgi:large subunit ribosomal protein L17